MVGELFEHFIHHLSSLTVELIIPRTTLIYSYNQRSENKAYCFSLHVRLTVELIIPRTTLIYSYNQRSENKADCFSLHVRS